MHEIQRDHGSRERIYPVRKEGERMEGGREGERWEGGREGERKEGGRKEEGGNEFHEVLHRNSCWFSMQSLASTVTCRSTSKYLQRVRVNAGVDGMVSNTV